MAQFVRLGKSEVRDHIKKMTRNLRPPPTSAETPANAAVEIPLPAAGTGVPPREIGGPNGPEPTRYGDWEVKGRCSDF